MYSQRNIQLNLYKDNGAVPHESLKFRYFSLVKISRISWSSWPSLSKPDCSIEVGCTHKNVALGIP